MLRMISEQLSNNFYILNTKVKMFRKWVLKRIVIYHPGLWGRRERAEGGRESSPGISCCEKVTKIFASISLQDCYTLKKCSLSDY